MNNRQTFPFTRFLSGKRFSRWCWLPMILLAMHVRAETTDWIYTVHTGDTLIAISSDYLINPNDWVKLQKINAIKNPRKLPPGLPLRIPVELLKLQKMVAEVVHVQGSDARIFSVKGGGPAPVEVGMLLHMGDQIRTGKDSNLTLRFADGSRLMVMANSQLMLDTMTTAGKSGVMKMRTQLQNGQVETQVVPLKGPASRYEIITPVIAVGVRGTDFRVSMDAEANVSRSEVLQGGVAVQGGGALLSVPAGFGTLAEAGKPLLPPVVLLQKPILTDMPELLQHVPLRFKWPALDNAVAYRAQVYADRNFQELLLNGAFNLNEAKWPDLPDGHYFLRVRGIDKQGLEGLNAEHAFTLHARPVAPFVSSPMDNGKLYGNKVQFQWARPENAETYHIQLASSREFLTPVVDIVDVKDLQYAATLEPGEYYWRIASRTVSGDEGPFSDILSFIVKPIPVAPIAPQPKIDSRQMLFQWPVGDEGQKYQFQLARDAAFSHIITDQTLDDPSITLKNPGSGHYFMRVKSIDADGFAGPFGASQRIEVPHNIPWWLIIPMLLFPLVL